MSDATSRNWRLVWYPDSLPDGWLDKLRERMIPFYLSPLHEFDISESGTGELKKAHYHLVLTFEGKKSFSQIKAICDEFGQPIPKVCDHVRGAVRYLIHADDADKYQYSQDDIKCFNGASVESYFTCSVFERTRICRRIIQLIREQGFTDYCQLVDYIDTVIDDFDWFDIVSNNTLFFKSYLFGKRDELKS